MDFYGPLKASYCRGNLGHVESEFYCGRFSIASDTAFIKISLYHDFKGRHCESHQIVTFLAFQKFAIAFNPHQFGTVCFNKLSTG